MKYYKVEVIANDLTIPHIEPEVVCILTYGHLTTLTEEQLEKKVKEDLKRIPELVYNKVNYSIEISERDFRNLQQADKPDNTFRPYKLFSQSGPLHL